MKALGKRYLNWLAQQPCAACQAWPVEVAHVSGPISKKTGLTMPRRKGEAFYYAIPLCPGCHRHGKRSIHEVGERAFFESLGVNPHQLVASYFARFFHAGAAEGKTA